MLAAVNRPFIRESPFSPKSWLLQSGAATHFIAAQAGIPVTDRPNWTVLGYIVNHRCRFVKCLCRSFQGSSSLEDLFLSGACSLRCTTSFLRSGVIIRTWRARLPAQLYCCFSRSVISSELANWRIHSSKSI